MARRLSAGIVSPSFSSIARSSTEYPATIGESDKVDTGEADEVIVALAKTVAELTSGQDGTIRQQLIEHLMREIMKYDAEFRSEEAADAIGSHVRH